MGFRVLVVAAALVAMVLAAPTATHEPPTVAAQGAAVVSGPVIGPPG